MHYSLLLNEKFDLFRKSLEPGSSPRLLIESCKLQEVINRVWNSKAAGTSQIIAEMLKVSSDCLKLLDQIISG